ncbi:MAG: hypothetical protein WBP64_06875 [Nitrososphaeraceae archaeon]
MLTEEPSWDVTKIRHRIGTQLNDDCGVSGGTFFLILGKLRRDGLIEEDSDWA